MFYASYQFFENYWVFTIHGLFFVENILYKSTVFNFENKVLSDLNR